MRGDQRGEDVDIVSVFEAVGKRASGEINRLQLDAIEECAIPGAGSCGGMYTANTMSSAIEAMGMSLPNSSAQARAQSSASQTLTLSVLTPPHRLTCSELATTHCNDGEPCSVTRASSLTAH